MRPPVQSSIVPKIEVLNAQTYNVYILYACAFSTTDAHSRVMYYVHELRTSLHYRITTLMLTCWMDLANRGFLVMQHILYGCQQITPRRFQNIIIP